MKHRRVAIAIVSIGMVLAASVRVNAQDAVHDHLRQVIAANSLVELGKTPFHLQMAFQYYDLKGKPADTGVLEEWWVSPDTYLVTVAVPSVNQGQPTPLDESQELDPREAYALNDLLGTETHPVSGTYADANKRIKEFRKRVGKAGLECFSVEKSSSEVCLDPQSDMIRMHTFSPTKLAVRNAPGVFKQTNISFDVAISYGGLPTVSGHLRKLEVFDSSQSDIVLPHRAPTLVRNGDMVGVTAGKVIKEVDAEFPASMHGNRGSWVVMLAFRVMKDGTVSHVVALYSLNPATTQSAIEAVKQYRFEPFLFEGKPIEVEMNVEVNFDAS